MYFFQRGDTIDIIAMNPSGLWRGRCQGRIGHFKFINVELLPDRHIFRSSEQRQKSVTSQRMQNSQDGPPKTVEDLLKRISLEVIIFFNTFFFVCIFTYFQALLFKNGQKALNNPPMKPYKANLIMGKRLSQWSLCVFVLSNPQ